MCVAFESRNQRLGGVIPDLDSTVVRCSQQVGLVGVWVVINMVDTLGIVRFESEVGVWRAQAPDLDGAIQTSGGKGVGILGVDGQAHDVVAVSLVDLDALPALVPVPQLNCHVIGGSQDEGEGRVDGDDTDVVGVSFEGGDFLGCVVVVDTDLKVVGTADDPVLASNESTCADRDVGELERFNDLLRFVRPDLHMSWDAELDGVKVNVRCNATRQTVIESSENPWFARVEVDSLDSLAASVKLTLS